MNLRAIRWPSNRNLQRCKQTTNCNNFFFINLFKSVQNIAGDKFPHPQLHFLTEYTVFGTMHRLCCRPVGSRGGALCQKLYIQSKVLLRMGKFVARNMLD